MRSVVYQSCLRTPLLLDFSLLVIYVSYAEDVVSEHIDNPAPVSLTIGYSPAVASLLYSFSEHVTVPVVRKCPVFDFN